MRNLVLLSAISMLLLACISSKKVEKPSNTNSANSVNWISLEEMQKKMKKEPRMVLVDVYATWCGPCKTMKKKSFTNPEIVKYINEKFYAVAYNAENSDTTTFKGKEYKKTSKKQRTHPLAIELAGRNGRLAYPTITYYDDKLNLLDKKVGLKYAPELMLDLKFFGEKIYENKTYNKYIEENSTSEY